MIFVVLALAWALYLIPKALKRSDALAGERPVEEYSDRLRVLVRPKRRNAHAVAEPQDAEVEKRPMGRVPRARHSEAAPRPLLTRAAAARAAQRRRQVLGVLVFLLAAAAILAAESVLPWWSLTVPGVAIVAFLTIARFSVRRQTPRRAPRVAESAPLEPVEAVVEVEAPLEAPVEVDIAVDRPAPAAPEPSVRVVDDVQEAIAAEGSLWDPLPMTLPTYVDKPAARRTVRTIELTGMASSGHDAADSALAGQARATERSGRSEQSARRAVGE